MLGVVGNDKGIAKVMKLGFVNGNAARILDDHTSIGVNLLEEVAHALNVESWKLCYPDFRGELSPPCAAPDHRQREVYEDRDFIFGKRLT